MQLSICLFNNNVRNSCIFFASLFNPRLRMPPENILLGTWLSLSLSVNLILLLCFVTAAGVVVIRMITSNSSWLHSSFLS